MPAQTGRQYGYTLLELIVVLLILGITISLVIPKIDIASPGSDLKSQTRQISSLIQAVRQESQTRGRILALTVEDGQTIKVMRLVNGEWRAPSHKLLKPYRLPEAFKARLEVSQSLFRPADEKAPAPALFLPDGQITPFRLMLSDAQTSQQRVLSLTGGELIIGDDPQ